MRTTLQDLTAVAYCSVVVLLVANSSGAATLATSHFNIPPFTAGIPVDGQGASDEGWAAPWQKLGGFGDRGHVVTGPAQEGTGAVQLFADNVFGTSVEREWFEIAPAVRVDVFVYVEPGAAMNGHVVTATPASGAIDPRRAASWQIEGSGLVTVFDSSSGEYVSTGFHTLPRQWNKYSLFADTNTSTYKFLFNDQVFNSPHPLRFMNTMFYVDGINLRAAGTLTSYIDNVTVTAVTIGDTNADDQVDLLDLNNVRNSFGGIGLGDTDFDGDVDLDDLNAVRNNYGAGFGSRPVPEPSAWALLALGVLSAVTRRWQSPG